MNNEEEKSKLELLSDIASRIHELKFKLENSKRDVNTIPERVTRGKGNKVAV